MTHVRGDPSLQPFHIGMVTQKSPWFFTLLAENVGEADSWKMGEIDTSQEEERKEEEVCREYIEARKNGRRSK